MARYPVAMHSPASSYLSMSKGSLAQRDAVHVACCPTGLGVQFLYFCAVAHMFSISSKYPNFNFDIWNPA